MPDEPLDVKPSDEVAPADPSPAPDVKPAADPKPAAEEAPSSLPDDKRTLADVVKETAAASESSPETPEEKPADEVVDATAPDDKPAEAKTDEKPTEPKPAEVDDSKLPFNKHPRFQELIKERNTLREESARLKPEAERAQAIEKFCRQHSITTSEFANVMELTAMVHVDPPKALERLKTFVEELEVSLGGKLPKELQDEVDAGTLSEARAKELVKARLASKGLNHQVKQTEAQAAQERQTVIVNAINSWDQQKRTADPAYDKKYALIEQGFIAACTRTPPRTPQEAIQLAEKVYADVNKTLSAFVPIPPKRRVLTTNGAVSKADITIDPNEDFRTALPKIARKVIAERR